MCANARLQLHRLLGVPIPPALLETSTGSVSAPTITSLEDSSTDSTADQSFFSFDAGSASPGWGTRFKTVSSNMKGKLGSLKVGSGKAVTGSRSVLPDSSDSSFDLPHERVSEMSGKEKAVARKRAAKLEQVSISDACGFTAR